MTFTQCLGYVLSLIVECFNIELWTLGDGSTLLIGHVITGTLVMILALHFLIPNFSH